MSGFDWEEQLCSLSAASHSGIGLCAAFVEDRAAFLRIFCDRCEKLLLRLAEVRRGEALAAEAEAAAAAAARREKEEAEAASLVDEASMLAVDSLLERAQQVLEANAGGPRAAAAPARRRRKGSGNREAAQPRGDATAHRGRPRAAPPVPTTDVRTIVDGLLRRSRQLHASLGSSLQALDAQRAAEAEKRDRFGALAAPSSAFPPRPSRRWRAPRPSGGDLGGEAQALDELVRWLKACTPEEVERLPCAMRRPLAVEILRLRSAVAEAQRRRAFAALCVHNTEAEEEEDGDDDEEEAADAGAGADQAGLSAAQRARTESAWEDCFGAGADGATAGALRRGAGAVPPPLLQVDGASQQRCPAVATAMAAELRARPLALPLGHAPGGLREGNEAFCAAMLAAVQEDECRALLPALAGAFKQLSAREASAAEWERLLRAYRVLSGVLQEHPNLQMRAPRVTFSPKAAPR